MPIIMTPQHVFDFETRMQTLAMNEYQALTEDSWWQKIAKRTTSDTKNKVINWLIESAGIVRGVEGESRFEKIVSAQMTYEQDFAHTGLKLLKSEMEDKDANGVDAAEHWATQIGHYIGYWPQKQVANKIKENPICYDGSAFFSAAHPSDPSNASSTPFANLFTGAASGPYPGACPITGVTIDTAIENIGKVLAYIATIPMPNGEDPRHLKVSGILHAPKLVDRVQQITKAQVLPQAASSGGGSADVGAMIKNWGFGEPIVAPELATAFGGNDSAYYIVMQNTLTNPLGAVIYDEREPFQILYHGLQDSPELARRREFQWLVQGRNTTVMGHPFLLFKAGV